MMFTFNFNPIKPTTSIHLTMKTWTPRKNQYSKSDETLFLMNPTVNQETNNVIFDIRDKVDKSKVIMEIFVAMIGLYMVFYRIKETKFLTKLKFIETICSLIWKQNIITCCFCIACCVTKTNQDLYDTPTPTF